GSGAGRWRDNGCDRPGPATFRLLSLARAAHAGRGPGYPGPAPPDPHRPGAERSRKRDGRVGSRALPMLTRPVWLRDPAMTTTTPLRPESPVLESQAEEDQQKERKQRIHTLAVNWCCPDPIGSRIAGCALVAQIFVLRYHLT